MSYCLFVSEIGGVDDVGVGQQLAGEASAEAAVTDLAVEAVTTPPPPPPDLTAAAFFDVDNTLVHGRRWCTSPVGCRPQVLHLRRSGPLRPRRPSFSFGRENSDDVAAGRRKALAFIEGRSTAELVAVGEEIYDEIIADKIWPGTRALAQMHLDAGQQVWLVTATPYELAATIAKRLGLTGALGTVAESVDGMFTGRLVGDILHGTGKAHAVRSLAIREGLNLRRCTAYSDSFNDVPMLSLVGTAVAINPDANLRDLARERGWEIRDFRTARKAARIGVPSALALGGRRSVGGDCSRQDGHGLPLIGRRRNTGRGTARKAREQERARPSEEDRGMGIADNIIGTHYRYPDYFEVDREKIREFARAVKDEHPAHYSEEAAKECGYDALIAPLTFLAVAGGACSRRSSSSSMCRSTWSGCCTATRSWSSTGRSWPATSCSSTPTSIRSSNRTAQWSPRSAAR